MQRSQDWRVPSGNWTLASMMRGEHSRKEPFKQLVNNYSKPLQRRVFFRGELRGSEDPRPHHKKRFTSFPSPAGMSLTKLPLGRNNSVMTSLFPPRESLLVTSRLGTGNSKSYFLRCRSLRWWVQDWLTSMMKKVSVAAGSSATQPIQQFSQFSCLANPAPSLSGYPPQGLVATCRIYYFCNILHWADSSETHCITVTNPYDAGHAGDGI